MNEGKKGKMKERKKDFFLYLTDGIFTSFPFDIWKNLLIFHTSIWKMATDCLRLFFPVFLFFLWSSYYFSRLPAPLFSSWSAVINTKPFILIYVAIYVDQLQLN
jgi:hypothetical protein